MRLGYTAGQSLLHIPSLNENVRVLLVSLALPEPPTCTLLNLV